MGYMTTITILNDGFGNIEKDPQKFTDNIKDGMNGINRWDLTKRKNINSYGVGNHTNLMEVAKSHHADDPRMYVIFQNSMDCIGWGNDSEHLEHRKRVLKIAKDMICREEEEIKRLEKEKTKR